MGLLAWLFELFANLKSQDIVLRSTIVIRPKQKEKVRMDTIRITTEFNATVSITPETAAGKPVTVDGIPQWSASDPLFVLQPAADGMSCQVLTPDDLSDGVDHPIDVTASVDADRGAGVRTVSLTFPFILSLPEATAIEGSVTLTPKV